ncbi:MAG: tetratricopeptide repeat protein [Gammaproteobacteria bacterium]
MRRYVFALVVVFLTIGALPTAQAQERPIPAADMSSMTPASRDLLQQAINYFERQRPALAGENLGRAYGRLGIHFLAHNRLAPAVVALQNAAELDASNFRWPYFLGLTQSFGGNHKGAASLFGQALRLNPDNIVAATRMGLALIDAGQPDRAASLLATLVEEPAGRSAAALAGLGRVAIESGKFRESIRWYEAALTLEPTATALHKPLLEAYRAVDDAAGIARHESKAGEQLPKLQDSLLALMQAHRQPSANIVAAGDAARDRGQVAQAAVFYDFAVAVNPEDDIARARLTALRAGAKSAPAIPDPTTAREFFERGVYLAATGDDAAAVGDYKTALDKNPDDVATHIFLGNAHMRQKQFTAAATQYATAGKADETNSELKYREGIAWLAAAKCTESETALLAGYELDQTALRIVQAIARLYATCPVDDTKRRAALKYAQVLYNAQPSLETSATLAMVLAANGQFEDAADYQRQAIFEGLKTGRVKEDPSLSENLERYTSGQKVDVAWPETHPIFYPPRPEPRS